MMNACPFPRQRPDITITPTDEPLFEVDFRELAWWFAVPEIGDRTLWALYMPPDWRLSSYLDMKALRPGEVHGIEGVEVSTVDLELSEAGELKETLWTLLGRLTETRVEWLAVMSIQDNKRTLSTLLEEDFDAAWGTSQRQVRHTGRFELLADGSYRQRSELLNPGEQIEATGVYCVTIGERSFSCLRVLDVTTTPTENSVMLEAFLTREGRTVLCRRYNGRLWASKHGSAYPGPPWDERLPAHNRIVIDGVTFVHWYDCLSDRACGIDPHSLPLPAE
jgi:hypothetical protein